MIRSYLQASSSSWQWGRQAVRSKAGKKLIMYRLTPHATTGEAPCKLFLSRNLRIHLHLLRPVPLLGTNRLFRRYLLIICQALKICYWSACNGKEHPSREKVLTWSCGAETWSTYCLSRSKRWLIVASPCGSFKAFAREPLY